METLLFSPDHLVVGSVMQSIFMYTFRTAFFLSAILLMVIILLQEGKGGGLASALGGQGAETFGVATGGVNKVTLFLAGVFLFSALGHALSTQGVIASMKKAAPAKPRIEDGGKSGGSEDEKDLEETPENGKGTAPPKKEEAPKDTKPKDAAPKDAPPKDAAPPK